MIDSDRLPNEPPDEAPPARLHAGLAVEAAFAAALATLLCWNAWPWIADQFAPETGASSAVIAAVLLYGLAWPALVAAAMGAQHYAFARLGARARLIVAATLLALALAALLGRLLAVVAG